MATKQTDLSQLRHVMVPSTLHFYYETQEDGTNVLRHIRVNQRTFAVPTDGVTIDVVPPDSVGTEQIADGSVKTDDLSNDVKKGLDELNNISLSDEDIEKWFDDDPTNDDLEEE